MVSRPCGAARDGATLTLPTSSRHFFSWALGGTACPRSGGTKSQRPCGASPDRSRMRVEPADRQAGKPIRPASTPRGRPKRGNDGDDHHPHNRVRHARRQAVHPPEAQGVQVRPRPGYPGGHPQARPQGRRASVHADLSRRRPRAGVHHQGLPRAPRPDGEVAPLAAGRPMAPGRRQRYTSRRCPMRTTSTRSALS